MTSILKVDTIQDQSGNNIINENADTITIGASGDTITIPSGATIDTSGATLTLPTTIEVDTIEPQSGTSLTLGASGDTITIPSGATLTNSGTATGFGVNTPAFSAERSSDQTITDQTRTTILFNNEFYDSSSAYDTSTGKFTPQVAGKYFVNANVQLNTNSNSNLSYAFIEMYKNASVITEDVEDTRAGYGRKTTCDVTAIVDMNGSSDFILIQAFIAEVSASGAATVRDMSTFQAFRIIE